MIGGNIARIMNNPTDGYHTTVPKFPDNTFGDFLNRCFVYGKVPDGDLPPFPNLVEKPKSLTDVFK